MVQKPKSLFTINSGNVQIGTEMVMMGEVVKKMLIMAIEGENIAFVLLEGDIDPNNAGKMINFGK